eukprot:TRINITY_DN110039_c0_g1_i1.p1 TRINITY_DN110039_c0_g1~~TRINITY_DN110039_c0_g1_i1.p1  ORF type:complete len:161 (+),score=27.97 TRINITY_DN110039_c0_g1_i1:40-522(+)
MAGCIVAAVVVGKVLGYPECCVVAHQGRISAGKLASSQLSRDAMAKAPAKCRYHWVPCDACAQKILSGTGSFKSLLTYQRPLIDLSTKLDMPSVQSHAAKVLTAEEYAVYEAVAAHGTGSLHKPTIPSRNVKDAKVSIVKPRSVSATVAKPRKTARSLRK